jgi:hypothetical protein
VNDFLKQRQQYILDGRPLPDKKQKQGLRKVGLRKAAKLAEQNQSTDSKLDTWFEERRLEMTGKCQLCGGKTEAKNDETYRRSIHHLLDKRRGAYPSVCLHPRNFLELCFWGNSCHSNVTNGTISWELLRDSHEWGLVILPKLRELAPLLTREEYARLPQIIVNDIKCG